MYVIKAATKLGKGQALTLKLSLKTFVFLWFQVLDASQLYTAQELDLELFKQNVQLFRQSRETSLGKATTPDSDLKSPPGVVNENTSIPVTCP